MKKFLLPVILTVVCSSIFASSLFSFEGVSGAPLYRENPADPYAFDSVLQYVHALDNDKKPAELKCAMIAVDKNTGEFTSFYDMLSWNENVNANSANCNYIHLKTGISAGFLKTHFDGFKFIPPMDMELNLGAYINSLFASFAKASFLGFDGAFLLGGTVKVDDLVTLRLGIHHFSGHYGDETLETLYSENYVDFNDSNIYRVRAYKMPRYEGDSSKDYYMVYPIEYCRDNSLIGAVQVDLPWGFNVYAEAELPMKKSWLYPLAHVSAEQVNPVYSNNQEDYQKTLIYKIGTSSTTGEGLSDEEIEKQLQVMQTANGSYKAWRIHTGFIWNWDVKFAKVFAGFDFQMHQDGQTKHELYGYSKDNPWEYEITVGGGLMFNERFRIEAYYHDGRVPCIQYFYQRMPYISIGCGLDCSSFSW